MVVARGHNVAAIAAAGGAAGHRRRRRVASLPEVGSLPAPVLDAVEEQHRIALVGGGGCKGQHCYIPVLVPRGEGSWSEAPRSQESGRAWSRQIIVVPKERATVSSTIVHRGEGGYELYFADPPPVMCWLCRERFAAQGFVVAPTRKTRPEDNLLYCATVSPE